MSIGAPTRQTSTTGGPPPGSGGGPNHVGPRRFVLARPHRRAPFILIGFLVIVSLFAGRLIDVQVINSEDLAAAAFGQRAASRDLPAVRGPIYDSSGKALAVSVEVRDITADQQIVEDPAQTAAVLGPMLNMPVDKLQEKLTGDSRYVVLKRGVEPSVWREIQDWRNAEENDRKVLQAIFSDPRTERTYPSGSLAANILGVTNADGVGIEGLEAGLEKELAGTPGSIAYESASGGSAFPGTEVTKVEPKPGLGVRLTIDSDLQYVTQQALSRQVKKAQADFGMAVAMEAKTGRILAMATAPSFDPNKPFESEPTDWLNKPALHAFEPGSTSKVMTMAAVLNEGVAQASTPFVVPPGLPRGDHVFTDHTPHGTLQLTLAGVLAQSSNIGTILAAEKLPEGKLTEYFDAFGIGSPSGLQFPGETAGLLPAKDTWSALTYPSLAFGQGFAVTAVQLTSVFATLANDGVRIAPKLIDAYVRPDGTSQATSMGEQTRVVSKKTARTVRRMMERVVSDDGTAPLAAIPGYRIGGKTGTAERFEAECGCYRGYTSSFMGIAPADKPEIVVGAWIDNPRAGHYGSLLAGPVFTEVTTAALQSMGVPPSGKKPSDIPTVPGQ